MLKSQHQGITTLEVNTHSIAAAIEGVTETANDHHRGDDEGLGCPAHEIEIGLADDLEHAQLLLAAAESVVENQTCHHQSGVHGGRDTDGQRHTEATHRTCTHDDHDDACEQGRNITIENHTERTVITGGNCRAQRLALGQLFTDTFIDQHVGVNGHTNRQHDTGNTGDRQRGTDQTHHTQQDHQVQDHGDIGHQTGEHVITKHEQRNQHGTDDTGHDTAADRVSTQGRIHTALFQDLHRCLQRILQHVGQFDTLFDREVTGDLTRTAGDLTIDARSAGQFTVQHDTEQLAHVLAGHFGKFHRAFGIQCKADGHTVIHRVAVDHGLLDVFTGQTFFGFLLDQIAAGFLLRVAFALALQGLGQNLITRLDVVLSQQFIALRMHHAELQERGTLDLAAGGFVFSLGQTRQRDRDAVGAVGSDLRLGYAHAVHTFTEDLDRLVQSTGALVIFQAVGLHSHQEGGTTLDVQAQTDSAGDLPLQAVQHRHRRIILFGNVTQLREVLGDVIGAGGLKESLISIHAIIRDLLLRRLGYFLKRGVFVLCAILKCLHQIPTAHWEHGIQRPHYNKNKCNRPAC